MEKFLDYLAEKFGYRVALLVLILLYFMFVFVISTTFVVLTSFTAKSQDNPIEGQQVLFSANSYYKDFDYYTVSYSDSFNRAVWAIYQCDNTEKYNLKRRSKFSSFFRLKHSDYKKIGYDRGHMVPAEIMSVDTAAYYGTFSMANVAPQLPRINRKYIKKTEELERLYLEDLGFIKVHLTTTPSDKWVNGINIPESFSKIIVDKDDNVLMTITITQ